MGSDGRSARPRFRLAPPFLWIRRRINRSRLAGRFGKPPMRTLRRGLESHFNPKQEGVQKSAPGWELTTPRASAWQQTWLAVAPWVYRDTRALAVSSTQP